LSVKTKFKTYPTDLHGFTDHLPIWSTWSIK
jgi:hypothetical protein